MSNQSKQRACISIRVVVTFGRKTAGGVGASLLLSDTRRRRLGLFIWFYLSLKMVCAIVIIEHVADLQGAGPRYPYPKEVWSPSGMFFRFLNE